MLSKDGRLPSGLSILLSGFPELDLTHGYEHERTVWLIVNRQGQSSIIVMTFRVKSTTTQSDVSATPLMHGLENED